MSYAAKLHRGWTMHRASELPHRPFLQPRRVSCNVGGAKGRSNGLLSRLVGAERTGATDSLAVARTALHAGFAITCCKARMPLSLATRPEGGAFRGSVSSASIIMLYSFLAAPEASTTTWVRARMRQVRCGAFARRRCSYHAWSIASLL